MGMVISLPMSGFLSSTLGWQFIFYVQGGLSTIWCILWIFLVYDSPQAHPRIDANELNLFESSMPKNPHSVNINNNPNKFIIVYL